MMKNIITFLIILNLIFFGGCSTSADEDNGKSSNHQESVDELYAIYDQMFLQYLETVSDETGKEVIRIDSLSDRYTVPKKLFIKGSPYEIGLTIGRIAVLNNCTSPQLRPGNIDLNPQIISMYQRIYPPFLEILRGISVAFDLTIDEMDMVIMEYSFFSELWGRLLRYPDFYKLTDFNKYGDIGPSHSCSVTSYYNGNSHLIGRNFDNPSDRPHYFASTEMDGSYKMMGNVIYFLYHWVVDGINEKGLSINAASNGGDYRLNESYPDVPAVFSGHMARIVMDTCATVEEALLKIGSVRVWFPNEGVHWLIADASGRSVIVEFDQKKKMVVFDRTEPYELITNTALQLGEDYVLHNCRRYSALKPVLVDGIFSMEEMRSLMELSRITTSGDRTLWTSVMDLNNLSFEIMYRKEYDKIYRFSFRE